MTQTYQEASEVVLSDIRGLGRAGISNLSKINLRGYNEDYQDYFAYRKERKKESGQYERLSFNNLGGGFFSNELESIITDFIGFGFLDSGKNINFEKINKYFKDKENLLPQ